MSYELCLSLNLVPSTEKSKKGTKTKRKENHKGARKDIIHSIDFMIVFKVNMDFTAFY